MVKAMTKLENVIETIKEIECPVHQIELKLEEAYREYTDGPCEVKVARDTKLDTLGMKAYKVCTDDTKYHTIVALVREGEEHYVSNVEDAYIE
jgi:hypothetical protein